ncbi:MAG: type II toxin-antitoxin system VapC family toxin [Verrucomicrobiae bacterium]|nr:type II toxin-antitoxin system VapC family toxin [Verrucomicrobiae bacterium]
MSAVFADTVYFLALLNPADQWHVCARDLSAHPLATWSRRDSLRWGVGDGLSRPSDRRRFARLLELLRAQPDVEIAPVSHQLFAPGCELHAQRPDKDWSLTDCTSFIVMKAKGLESALTADHHFAQTGYSVLMR